MTQHHLVAVLGRGVVDPDDPVVTADDLGLTRGDGCFDTTRVLTDALGAGTVENLTDHLRRLARSASALGIQSPPDAVWADLVGEAVGAWSTPGEAKLTLLLTRGREWVRGGAPTVIVTLSQVSRIDGVAGSDAVDLLAARRGITAVTLTSGHASDAFRNAPWLLGGVKTLSYVVKVAARREAALRGADDAIFTTTDGYALDGTTSGLLVLTGGVLRTTPTGDTGLLESVTVATAVESALADGVLARHELIPVADLFTADGVWLVSSARGPAPVTRLDGRQLAVDAGLTTALARWAGF